MFKQLQTKFLALLAIMLMGAGNVWAEDVHDVITAADLAATGTSYTAFSGVQKTSDAVYAGKSALNNNANIQLRSSGSDCGIVSTTSGGKLKSVTINVASGTNTIDVYGSNTPYTSAENLYNANYQGTKLGSVSATGTITVTGDYAYVGIRSYNGAIYLSSVEIVWETRDGVATTTTIDYSGITNTDVYTSTAAGSLSAIVKDADNNVISGAAVTWSSSNTDAATIANDGTVTLVAAGTTTITASFAAVEGQYQASSATYELTVTDGTPNTDTWVLTNLADLTSSDVFVIVGNNGSTYAMSNNNGTNSAPSAVAVNISNDMIVGTVADNIKWNISNETDGYVFYPAGSTTTWLYTTTFNNGLRVGGSANKYIALDNTTNYLTINDGSNTRYIGIYSSQDWRTYTSVNSNIKDQSFSFYKKVSGGVQPPYITADNVSIAYDATSGSISYTVNNSIEGGVVSANTTSDWLTFGTVGDETVPFTASTNEGLKREATVTLTYTYGDNETVTKDVTVTQATNPNAAGTANNPYSVAQARAAIDAGTGTTDVYVTGIVTRNTYFSESAGTITYFISDDGTETTELEVYSGKGINGASFTAETDIQAGDVVVVHGNLTLYNETTYEFASGNQLVSLDRKEVKYYLAGSWENGWTTGMVQLTKDGTSYATTKEITSGTTFKIVKVDETVSPETTTWYGGATNDDTYGIHSEWYEDIALTAGDGGKNFIINTAGEFTFTVDATDGDNLTLTVTGWPEPVWTLKGSFDSWGDGVTFTSQGDGTYKLTMAIEAGAEFKVVDENNQWYSAANTAITEENNSVELSTSNSSNMSIADAGTYTFTLNTNNGLTLTVTGWPISTDGNMFVKMTSGEVEDGAYLIVYEDGNLAFNGSLVGSGLSDSGNHIGVRIVNNRIVADETTKDFLFFIQNGSIKSASGYYIGRTSDSNGMDVDDETVYTNTISIDNDNNVVIKSSGNAYLRYNTSGNGMFRYYKSSTYTAQKDIQLYKLVTLPVATATIAAACTDGTKYYGTYSNTSAFILPEGVTASEISVIDGELLVEDYEAGAIVPANTGVMISSATAGEKTFYLTTGGESVLGEDNMLRATGDGITADAMAEEDPACLYYRLTMHNGETIGFWWGAEDGAAFTVAANKAYLAVPANQAKDGFAFGNDGGATEIVLNALKGEQNGEMYNLQGQKVGSEYKGIVIVNGKKFINK